ncbi:hypothetical protein J4479_02845 [Candidatus Woesearchaeota archaeon]|nr:hypothetical protein [Candidatus Woesearchaeota archaeon]
MPKTEKLFSKVMMIIFLALIVLGFTIPGFINNSAPALNQASNSVEPRLCKTDADCYLTCDNQPLRALCWQNLCQQNECGPSYFEYDVEPAVEFKLEVETKNKIILTERTNSQNFFVEFLDGDRVKTHSPRLSLEMILGKAGIILADNCLRIDAQTYCSDAERLLSILINGQDVADPGSYIPNNGDEIKIGYGMFNEI